MYVLCWIFFFENLDVKEDIIGSYIVRFDKCFYDVVEVRLEELEVYFVSF